MSSSRRTFTAEFKQEAVQLVAQQGRAHQKMEMKIFCNLI
jgi:transposase-like protein